MFTYVRQSTHKLRLWLIAAAAILALTSVLEASHVHDVFTQADDQCALCQHPVALDKLLGSSTPHLFPFLITVIAVGLVSSFVRAPQYSPTNIRAPPIQLHAEYKP